MRRPTTFVILTTQRSGSGWLVDLLDDHPSVVAYEELFKVTETTVARHGASVVPRFEVMVGPRTWSTSRGLVLKRYDYLRGLARAHPGADAVGFKLMYDQTRDHPWLVAMLIMMRARFVHLVRRNSLSAVLSDSRHLVLAEPPPDALGSAIGRDRATRQARSPTAASALAGAAAAVAPARTPSRPRLEGVRISFVLKWSGLGGAERQALVLARHLQSVEGAIVEVQALNDAEGRAATLFREAGIPWRARRGRWRGSAPRTVARLAPDRRRAPRRPARRAAAVLRRPERRLRPALALRRSAHLRLEPARHASVHARRRLRPPGDPVDAGPRLQLRARRRVHRGAGRTPRSDPCDPERRRPATARGPTGRPGADGSTSVTTASSSPRWRTSTPARTTRRCWRRGSGRSLARTATGTA